VVHAGKLARVAADRLVAQLSAEPHRFVEKLARSIDVAMVPEQRPEVVDRACCFRRSRGERDLDGALDVGEACLIIEVILRHADVVERRGLELR
jgi:hypothetical protein